MVNVAANKWFNNNYLIENENTKKKKFPLSEVPLLLDVRELIIIVLASSGTFDLILLEY